MLLINIRASYGLHESFCDDFSLIEEFKSTALISAGESLEMSIKLLRGNPVILNRLEDYYHKNFVGAYQYDMLNDAYYLRKLEVCLEDSMLNSTDFIYVMSTFDFIGKVPAAILQVMIQLAPIKLFKYLYAKSKLLALSLIGISSTIALKTAYKLVQEKYQIESKKTQQLLEKQDDNVSSLSKETLNFIILSLEDLKRHLSSLIRDENDINKRRIMIEDLNKINNEIEKNNKILKIIQETP